MEPSHDIAREKHRAGHAREENNVLVPRLSESRVNRFCDFLNGQSDILARVKDARGLKCSLSFMMTTTKQRR